MYVVVLGDPFSGMTIVGPFTQDEAYNYVGSTYESDWFVVGVVPPPDGTSSLTRSDNE